MRLYINLTIYRNFKELKNNLLIEMMPLIAFFVAYYVTKNIYTATMVCIIASWLQVGLLRVMNGSVGKNTWISTILITVLGTMTVALHNKTFIMLKPTVLYWIFGIGLFISARMGKNPMKIFLQEHISLDNNSWKQINLLWVGFFLFMGILNLVIAFHFSEYLWVKFKVFGSLILMLCFTALTGLIIYQKTKGRING